MRLICSPLRCNRTYQIKNAVEVSLSQHFTHNTVFPVFFFIAANLFNIHICLLCPSVTQSSFKEGNLPSTIIVGKWEDIRLILTIIEKNPPSFDGPPCFKCQSLRKGWSNLSQQLTAGWRVIPQRFSCTLATSNYMDLTNNSRTNHHKSMW